MTRDDDPELDALLKAVTSELRRPAPSDPWLATRVLAEVRKSAPRRAMEWFLRPRQVPLSPAIGLLWAAAIAHIVAGNVDYVLAGTILIGSVPGVWLGSHMAIRLPAGTLRTVLGVVLIGAAMGLGSKAGLPIPPVAIAVVPGVLAAIVLWQRFKDPVRRSQADTEAKEPGH